jgi:hypothetical protein
VRAYGKKVERKWNFKREELSKNYYEFNINGNKVLVFPGFGC